MGETTDQLEGFDVDAVDPWLAEHVPELQQPLRWKQLVGGHSNLTCLLEDASGAKAVIRRPPLGEVQPRAHDMAREFAVISALWPTDVPVARPYAVCTDLDVNGAVFYVMGFVGGRSGSTDWLDTPELRRSASESFIDTMAKLHRLDVDAIGLGDLTSGEDYLGRQLRSWNRSWVGSVESSGIDDPRFAEIHDWLVEHQPQASARRIVHGDYGFNNLIIDDDGNVAAVVDWEVCTLGDALSDLAFILNKWAPAADEPGWLTRDEMIARYQEGTGADLALLDYYVAFNYWRSASIIHGVYARYAAGQKDATNIDVEHFRKTFLRRVQQADDALVKLRSE